MKKLFFLLSVLIYIASVMGMPQKVSLTPLTSDEEFGAVQRGIPLQNFGSNRDRYPIYLLGPYQSEDRQKPSLNTLRGLNIFDIPFTYSKRFIDKKSLDSIGGGHLI